MGVLLQSVVAAASLSTGVIPAPGSGAYNTSIPGNYTQQGTPYDPGNGVSYGSIGNGWDGLFRRTYAGIWSNSGSNDNPSIFNNSPMAVVDADVYLGFGNQTSTQSNYCMEWKGYIMAPATTYFNFVLESDDVAMFWIGAGARNPDNLSPECVTYNNRVLNTNSVLLTQNVCYPIRVRFQEYTGSEYCQLYMSQENGTLYAMNSYFMLNNHGTDGY